MKTMLKITMAGLALCVSASLFDASAQTATYGGRTYYRSGGRTYSGGRVVNPFGPPIRSYRSTPAPRGGSIDGRQFYRRGGRTVNAAGRTVSPFGAPIRRYGRNYQAQLRRYQEQRAAIARRGMAGSRGRSPYSSAYRNQQLLEQQRKQARYRSGLNDALSTFQGLQRRPAIAIGGLSGAGVAATRSAASLRALQYGASLGR